jgi:molybdopterin molybdotransferase
VIAYDRALELVLSSLRPLPPVRTSIGEAKGLVLAADVKARFGLPRFNQSAMDGVAIRSVDVVGATSDDPVTLSLRGESAAGGPKPPHVGRGRATKIFTGAPLPRGADAVVMKEACVIGKDTVRVTHAVKAGDHIRRAGEELYRGEPVLSAGQVLTPPAVGVLATFGIDTVAVRPTPRTRLIVIGDELAEPGARLTSAMIHDANGPALRAAFQGLGVREIAITRVGDNLDELVSSLTAALAGSDLVVTVGGASVGDHDHVAEARRLAGVHALFDRVAIKPGKPNLFGMWRARKPVFSLPGNPVSALVSFHQIVAPAVRLLSGQQPLAGTRMEAVLDRDVRKKPGRLEWLRGVIMNDGERLSVAPVLRQGSHMLTGLAEADVLVELPSDVAVMKAGESVHCIRLAW